MSTVVASPAERVQLNAGLLGRLNKNFALLNPHAADIAIGSREYLAMRLPPNLKLSVVRDPSCGGELKVDGLENLPNPLESYNDSKRNISLATMSVASEESVGDLQKSIAHSPCVLSVFPSSSLKSALLPAGAKAADYAGVNDAAAIVTASELFAEGERQISQRMAAGVADDAQVFSVGHMPDQPTLADLQKDPTGIEPVLSPGTPPGLALNIMTLPTDRDAGSEIAVLNNQMIAAVDRGAQALVVPPVEPSLIIAGSQYAKAHGVQVYVVTQNNGQPPASIVQAVNSGE